MKYRKIPFWRESPNDNKRKKFKAYVCYDCLTICDADEETASCGCITVAAADVPKLVAQGKWRLAQINILFAGADPKLPLLKRAKKGEVQNVQE